MTLHYNHGLISFECDCCDEVLDTKTDSFTKAGEIRREEGWKAVQNNKAEWEHRCPDCA